MLSFNSQTVVSNQSWYLLRRKKLEIFALDNWFIRNTEWYHKTLNWFIWQIIIIKTSRKKDETNEELDAGIQLFGHLIKSS